jgi:uncharacterized protein with FMN-binding domain
MYVYIYSHTHLQAKLKEAEAGVVALEAASKEHTKEHETLLQGLQVQLEAKDKQISDLEVLEHILDKNTFYIRTHSV